MPKPKMYKCRAPNCSNSFERFRSFQTWCSPDCGIAISKIKAEKKRLQDAKDSRKETKRRKEVIKTIPELRAEAQEPFNQFIRLRDIKLPCISCGRFDYEIEWTRGGKWDCGHYLSRGAFPELRFTEDNAHKQCKSCNGGSGKYAKKNKTVGDSYRINLIAKIGIDRVLWLEGPHELPRWRHDDLRAIKQEFKIKLKELTDESA